MADIEDIQRFLDQYIDPDQKVGGSNPFRRAV
jgi:hypothetical protein